MGVLFGDLCPNNKVIEHVLLKISVLNDIYSTRTYDTYSVAKHIVGKNIDVRLYAADYSLVNNIAALPIRGKTTNFYSFASKYCSRHKPKSSPV